jgi:hypothetical protein
MTDSISAKIITTAEKIVGAICIAFALWLWGFAWAFSKTIFMRHMSLDGVLINPNLMVVMTDIDSMSSIMAFAGLGKSSKKKNNREKQTKTLHAYHPWLGLLTFDFCFYIILKGSLDLPGDRLLQFLQLRVVLLQSFYCEQTLLLEDLLHTGYALASSFAFQLQVLQF